MYERLILYRRSPKSRQTFSFRVFFSFEILFPPIFSAFALLLMVVVHFVPTGRFLSWKIVKRDCHFRATDFDLYTFVKVGVELLKCVSSEESRFDVFSSNNCFHVLILIKMNFIFKGILYRKYPCIANM